MVVTCIRLGLGRQVGELLLDNLTNLQHQVKTSHGKSKPYIETPQRKHFGTEQGSGGSPTAWNIIDDALLNTLDKQRRELNLTNPTGTINHHSNEIVFVDDANLTVNGPNYPRIV